jgi:hypothetical protein
MSLPNLLDYQHAVLHPEYAFPHDPDLRDGHAARTPLNTAAVASGGFAATFRIDNPPSGPSYAVRCFHKLGVDDRLAERYDQIARFVGAHRDLEFLVDVRYNPAGVVVGGKTYPTVRMPWVVGDPLGDWVDDHFDDRNALEAVRVNLADAVSRLRPLHAAHGDLQHGNIIIGSDHSVSLIDYDGMYLPELAPHGTAERGHPNYQHPDRNDTQFGEDLDEFSAYVIDLSLAAIAHNPDLWERFGGGGQNLIFSASDFADPDRSKVFASVFQSPLAPQAQRLKNASLTTYEQIPRALRGEATRPRTAPVSTPSGFDIMLASNAAALRKRQGDQVMVVGTILTARIRQDKRGNPIAFLNFGQFDQGDFTIVAFGVVATQLQRRFGGTNLTALQGARVALTELVTLYENKYPTTHLTPQMVLSRASQLRILDFSRYTALTARAHQTKYPHSTTRTTPPPARPAPGPTASVSTPSPTTPRKHTTTTPADSSELLASILSRYPAPSTPSTIPKATAPIPPPFPSPAMTNPPSPRITPHRITGPAQPDLAYSPNIYKPAMRRPHRRAGRIGGLIAVAVIAVLSLIGLIHLGQHSKRALDTDPAPPAPPVAFQSPSHNLACRITTGSPSPNVRCDAHIARFTAPPPRPLHCDQSTYGHTLGLMAGAPTATFLCPPDSLINDDLPVLDYGDDKTVGDFECSSSTDGITCRDTTTNHGFHIERDSYSLF